MKKEPSLGSVKHTDPNFWRYALTLVLLCCGDMMIGDGIARWMTQKPQTWLWVGGCVVLWGIIGTLKTRRCNETDRADDVETKQEPPS